MTPLKLLFVTEQLNWPRQSGADVHGSQLMRALAARGHRVSLGTFRPTPPEAMAGLGLAAHFEMPDAEPVAQVRPATRLQARFERFWGTDPVRPAAVAAAVRRESPDAVVVLGADALPLFRGVPPGVRRVWYAADDRALHHWSRVRPLDRTTWGDVKLAAVNAGYEWAFAGLVDRVWVVSAADRRAMRVLTGGAPVDVVPNGVDAEHFRPPDPVPDELPASCVFWGRLDFGPNEDAVRWFGDRVWPRVRAKRPDARFDVFGFRSTARVGALCRSPGVSLTADLPDLRGEICRRSVVVLPFVSGRGIKNKLLEAAALGRPIVCTPQALTGTRGAPPVLCESTAVGFARELLDAWAMSPGVRADLGRQARAWVVGHHTWAAAARVAEAGFTAPSRS